MLCYQLINRHLFTDTFFDKTKGKSIRGNTCAQIFVIEKCFVAMRPKRSNGDLQYDLHMFCKDNGVPI